MSEHRMQCRNVAADERVGCLDALWRHVPGGAFVDVVTGEQPFLSTEMRVCRSDELRRLFFLFDCEDDEVCSTFRMHDEPIYREDVCELFIADRNDLSTYIELEASPYAVRFDGVISYSDEGARRLNMSYDINGWKIERAIDEKTGHRLYLWSIPYDAFRCPPKAGKSWRFNAFRIDHHSKRGMALQAWQKTGEPNFHVPSAFGYLDFV